MERQTLVLSQSYETLASKIKSEFCKFLKWNLWSTFLLNYCEELHIKYRLFLGVNVSMDWLLVFGSWSFTSLYLDLKSSLSTFDKSPPLTSFSSTVFDTIFSIERRSRWKQSRQSKKSIDNSKTNFDVDRFFPYFQSFQTEQRSRSRLSKFD